MMKHIWSILCERTSVDSQTNLISYLTAIEAISIKRLPFRIPFLVFATLWRSDSEHGGAIELKLVMVNPDRSEKVVQHFKTQSTATKHRVNLVLNGMEFSQSGTYRFRLERLNGKRWERVSELPLDVTVAVQKQEIEKKPEVHEATSKVLPKKTDRSTAQKKRNDKD